MAKYFVMKVTPVFYAIPGPFFEKSESAVTLQCQNIHDNVIDAFRHVDIANKADDYPVYLHHYAVFLETEDGFELQNRKDWSGVL